MSIMARIVRPLRISKFTGKNLNRYCANVITPSIDGMDRYPSPFSTRGLLRGADYFGTFVFAASGSITAATYGLDLLGSVALGTITAVGGGTVRDVVILGRKPFWSGDDGESEYLWMSLIAAATAFFAYPYIPDFFDSKEMEWADAISLGAFAVIGAQNGIRAGLSPALCVLCGVSTGTFGGATRDVLAKRPVRIFNSYAELYATTAAGGAAAYLLARAAALPLSARVSVGVASTVALRFAAWTNGLTLPDWKSMGHAHLLIENKK